jgi:hypothetical protein
VIPTKVVAFRRPAPAPARLGVVAGLVGEARYRDPRSGGWRPLRAGMKLRPGTEVVTGRRSRLTIGLAGGDAIRLAPVSCCVLREAADEGDRRRVRLECRFGGWSLLPAGDPTRAFRVAPLLPPTDDDGTLPHEPPDGWCLADRAVEVVVEGDRIELRAVNGYRAPAGP